MLRSQGWPSDELKEREETIRLFIHETMTDFEMDGIIVVYDVTSQETFKSVQDWILPTISREDNALPLGYRINKLLIGNKADLLSKKIVSSDQGKMLAEQFGMQFIETSAKLGVNVNRAFQSMAMDIKQRITIEGLGRYSLTNETSFVVKVVDET